MTHTRTHCAAGTPLKGREPCPRCGATTGEVCGPHYAHLIRSHDALVTALARMLDNSCCIHSPKSPPADCECSWCESSAALKAVQES